MNAIFKYPLLIEALQVIDLPKGAVILTASYQNNQLFIWALIDSDSIKTERRTIETIATGEPMLTANRKYIATALTSSANFVTHVFERIPLGMILPKP